MNCLTRRRSRARLRPAHRREEHHRQEHQREVALNGTVPSYPQYLEAAAARRVTGVTSVHNHLEVVLPTGDFGDDTMLTTAGS
jgi:osmotically-inducible protein OsmY